jgi:anti-sigma factor RsiW
VAFRASRPARDRKSLHDTYDSDDRRSPSADAAVRPLTCQEVLEQLSEYLDAELHGDGAGAIDQHLLICTHCRVEVQTLRRTIVIFRCEQVSTPDGIGHQLRQALDREYAGNRERNPGGGEGKA